VRVGVEATGSMHWFLNLMEELGNEFQVGHPAQIRRKQKHDRRDADLIRSTPLAQAIQVKLVRDHQRQPGTK